MSLFRLGLLLVLAGLLVLPAAAEDGPWLTGRLLVASRQMRDPNFRETVIYMVEHDAEGAFGLVVNRPLGAMPLDELLTRLGAEGKSAEGAIRLYSGGPVQQETGYVLQSTDLLVETSKAVDDDFAISVGPQILEKIGRGEGPAKALLILGYAGWAPGQLEAEIAEGGWETVPADPDLVFDRDDESKWERALALVTIEL